MRLKSSELLLLVIMGIASAYLVMALFLPYWEDKLFPIFICGIILILGMTGLVKKLMKEEKLEGRDETSMRDEGSLLIRRGDMTSVCAVLGFPLALFLLGFNIGLPLSIILYLKLRKKGWFISLILTALVMLLIIGLFESMLMIDFYEGLIFELFR